MLNIFRDGSNWMQWKTRAEALLGRRAACGPESRVDIRLASDVDQLLWYISVGDDLHQLVSGTTGLWSRQRVLHASALCQFLQVERSKMQRSTLFSLRTRRLDIYARRPALIFPTS